MLKEKITAAIEKKRPVYLWGIRAWGCTLGVWDAFYQKVIY